MKTGYVPTLPPDATAIRDLGSWAFEELQKVRSALEALDFSVPEYVPETVDLTTLWDKITELQTRVNNCDCAEDSTEFYGILDTFGDLLLDARGGYVQEA